MSESLWSVGADELLRRTASADPTPGGGSIAAVTGALGIGLMLMAIRVSDDARLDEHRDRLEDLLERVRRGVDDDVADFEAVMAAYRLDRSDPARADRVRAATIRAAIRPLEVARALVDAHDERRSLAVLVKRSIVSDVDAGAHIALGAARALLETSAINRSALARMGADAEAEFEARAGELAELSLDELEGRS